VRTENENYQSKLLKTLAQEPQLPYPSKEEMLRMFRNGEYMKLVPYFKNKIGRVRTSQNVRKIIMKEVDPESYAIYLQRKRERGAKKKGKDGK
jgi:hypothetical protein